MGFTGANMQVSYFDTFFIVENFKSAYASFLNCWLMILFCIFQVLALDARYRLSESKDYEVKVGFLQLAILSKCRDFYGEVEKTLKEVGRMKYLLPLYTALVQGIGKGEQKILAKRVFAEARDCYHPIAQGVVESIFAKHL